MRGTIWMVLAFALVAFWIVARVALAMTGFFLHVFLGLAVVLLVVGIFRRLAR